jgi:hypothetical protein
MGGTLGIPGVFLVFTATTDKEEQQLKKKARRGEQWPETTSADVLPTVARNASKGVPPRSTLLLGRNFAEAAFQYMDLSPIFPSRTKKY